MNAARRFEQAVADEASDVVAQAGDALIEFAAGLHHQFGGGRWRGSAYIGDEIRNREVRLVADARNDRNGRDRDSAGDALFIEAPQILKGAAATSENDHVDALATIEKLQSANDFKGGALALNPDGIKRQLYVGKAPAEDAHNVAHSGATR